MRWKAAARLRSSAFVLAGACALGVWTQGYAQSNTGTIRGFVRDTDGTPLANASVVATQTGTNFQRGALTTATGFYNLPGLPPGQYSVRATMLGHADFERPVRVLIGQLVVLDITMGVQAVALEGIEATAARVVETTTPEVATNITPEQIEALPMNDRNFLSLAQLAPGVTFGCSGNCAGGDGGGINVGASSANNVNVFVDGVSFKNDILKGGVAGQDASKGNPFPQVAVQEFRVITQQYKAEYQKATSAIVTAQTKSGTNDWKLGMFGFRQDKNLIEQDFFALKRCADGKKANPNFVCAEQPKQDRWQLGGSLGGPLMRDKLFFFGAYENNLQDRAFTVTPNAGGLANWPTALQDTLRTYAGTFPSEFRSHLYFGKLTYTPQQQHRFELSGNIRDEFDVRNFGNTDALENAEDFHNNVRTGLLKHQYSKGNLLNEAQVSYQWYRWFPVQLHPDIPGRNYSGTLKIGGRCCPQDQTQKRWELRNDVSYTLAGWYGDHVFKVGGSADFIRYDIIKQLNVNPQFTFVAPNSTMPTQVAIGFGTPNIGADNKQFGIYAQDDWSLSPRLTLNLGLRWDYETNGLNNDYVTPANVVAELGGRNDLIIFNPQDYFTDGNDRPAFKGMVQPRLGFSYDLSGRNSTVLFGGFGVYYDRDSYATLIGERERLVWTTYTIRFSADGSVAGTVPWDPAYLGPNGRDLLQARIQSGSFGKPEVYLLNNDTRPPKVNQYSIGVRQTWRDVLFSLNYSGVRGYNEFTWMFANRNPLGSSSGLFTTPSFQNVIVSTDEGRSWYDAIYFKAERQYRRDSRWGATLAYSLSWADANFDAGRDFAGLSFRLPSDFERRRSERDERHKVTANAIVGLPFDFRLSGILNLASGRNFTVNYGGNSCLTGNRDCIGNEYPNTALDQAVALAADSLPACDNLGSGVLSCGTDPFIGKPLRHSFLGIPGWAFRNVDLRLEKDFVYRGQRIGFIAEAFNIFNYDNFVGYDGRIADVNAAGKLVNINQNFGVANGVVTDTRLTGAPRRFQFGVQYSMD